MVLMDAEDAMDASLMKHLDTLLIIKSFLKATIHIKVKEEDAE